MRGNPVRINASASPSGLLVLADASGFHYHLWLNALKKVTASTR